MPFYNALLFIAFVLLAIGIILLAYATLHPQSREAARVVKAEQDALAEAARVKAEIEAAISKKAL